MDFETKGVQNSRNGTAKWPKPEEFNAEKRIFEVLLAKKTQKVATGTSHVGTPKSHKNI